jgi:hypothetical protein
MNLFYPNTLDKMSLNFEKQVQDWVSIDNQLKILNDKVKELRDKRNNLTTNLSKYAENNNLANSIIQISDGKLRFVNSKVSEPLTFKYLEKALTQIIKSDSQVKQIIEHIKTNRDTKIISEIKRINNN